MKRLKQCLCLALLSSMMFASSAAESLFELNPTPEAVAAWDRYRCCDVVKMDGSEVLHIGKNPHSVRIPLDAKELAGKKVVVEYTFRLKDVPAVPEDGKQVTGFNLMLFHEAGGKGVYSHKPQANGTTGWIRERFTADVKPGTEKAEIIIRIAGRSGEAWVKSLSITPADAPASAKTDSKTLLRLPPIEKAPVADGRISENEYLGGTMQFGGVIRGGKMLGVREVFFYFAYDDKNLYFAQRSEMPPLPIKLGNDCDASIVLLPPGAKKEYVFSVRKDGAVSTQSGSWWVTEMVIPLEKVGVKAIEYGKPWRIQMIRQWQNVRQTTQFSSEEYAEFIPEKNIPAVSFTGFGPRYKGNGYNITWQMYADRDSEADVNSSISSIENPRVLNARVRVPAGKPVTAEQREILPGLTIRTLDFTVSNPADGKVYLRRTFDWNSYVGDSWVDPDPPLAVQVAAYPTAKKVKTRFFCDKKEKLAPLKEVEFLIRDEKGKVYSAVRPELRKSGDYYKVWDMPALPEGKYHVVARGVKPDGETVEVDDYFTIRKFAWQNQNIGRERIIIPPYRPLTVKGDEVHALLTGYKVGDLLWDAVYAQGENLLAAPVTLSVNGQKITAEKPVVIEKSDDRVVLETAGFLGTLKIRCLMEYDYDGMCKTTLLFDPGKNFEFREMHIDIPLKEKYAKLFHSLGSGMRQNAFGFLPESEGRVFDSRKIMSHHRPGFLPYVWFGDIYKGICWFAEDSYQWEVNHDIPSQEIIRGGQAATLRLNIIGKAVQRRAPFSIVMGFQPTPVRPRPEGYRKFYGTTWGPWVGRDFSKTRNTGSWYPDRCEPVAMACSGRSIGMRADDGPSTPPGGDWSLIDYLIRSEWKDKAVFDAFVAAYLKKHGLDDGNFSIWSKTVPGDEVMVRLWQGAGYLRYAKHNGRYFNSRELCPSWPERDMYVAEWYLGEFPPPRSFYDEYSCNPSPEYADFMLYQCRENVRRGFGGIYYDNLFDVAMRDPVRGARESEDGKVIPYFPIFTMRDFLKRTAVMLTQEKKFLLGRPALYVHMTNVNMVPWNSWAAVTLDWEMNYGNRLYHERFPEAYCLAITTGTQTGSIPAILIQASGGDIRPALRSLLAYTFAFDLFFQLEAGVKPRPDFYVNAHNLIRNFGYGDDSGTTVYPGYDPENPVKCDAGHVRVTTLKRKDGKYLLLVGNLGETARVNFTLPGKFSMKNAETGAPEAMPVPVAKYGYALLELTPVTEK